MTPRRRFASLAAAIALLAGLLPLISLALAESGEFAFGSTLLERYVGETVDLLSLLTGNIENASLLFESSDTAIVSIDPSGTAQILSEGRARITARTSDGRTAYADLRAIAAKPVRRALILSEQRYRDGRVRTGAVNTVQGLSDTLSSLRYRSGTGFDITVRIDVSEAYLASLIESTFSQTQPDDISLFYISCHGEMVAGEPALLLHDGTTITVRRLEEMLRCIQGQVIVLLDFCQSGSFIGSAAAQLYAETAVRTFSNSALLNGKYLVIASCGADEDSYRISDTKEDSEASMSTVFARSLCEGLGWDLDKDRSVTMRADSDHDGVVTFTELWLYTRRRVYYHLSGTGVSQTVMAWPEINEAELFARQFA